MAGVPEVKTRILGMNDQAREKLLDDLLKEIKPKLKAKQIEDLIGHNKALLNSLRMRENISVVKDGKEVITANILDDLENKLNTSKSEKTRDFKKAARDVVRAGNNIEKMDQTAINQKLEALAQTVDQDIEGHITQIYQLAQTAGIDVDKFFGGFDKVKYETQMKNSKEVSKEVMSANAGVTEALKSGKTGNELKSIVEDGVKKSTDFLVKKLNFDEGVANIAVVAGGIWAAFKGYGAFRDLFPSGFQGLVLTLLSGYAIAKNVPMDKVKAMYEKMTGDKLDNNATPNNELAHRNLESDDFKQGEIYMKGILTRFKKQDSELLNTYVDKTNKNFNIEQLIADYSAQDVLGVKPVADQKILHTDMNFDNVAVYDHFAILHGKINDAGNANAIKASINKYLADIGMFTTANSVEISDFKSQFTEYENTQKARYNILKRSGLEIDMEAIKGWSSEAKSKIVTDIDKIVDPKKHLNDNYILSDTDKNTILAMPGIKQSVAQSTELSVNEIKEVDDFAKQWNISLTPQSKASLMKAYLSLKNKTIGGIKLDPTYNFMGKAYPALIIGGKIAVPLSISSPTEGTIGYTDTFLNSFNPKGSMGKISAVNQVGFDVLFERALLFANAVSSFAGKGEGKHEDNNGHYKYFDYDPVRGMYFSTNSSLISSLTTTTKSEQIFGTESLKLAGLTDKTDIDQWLYWINNNFTGKRKIKDQTGEKLVAVPLWSINYGINPFAVGVKNENLAQTEMRKQESDIEVFTNTLKGYVSDIGSVGKVFFDATIGATRYVLEKGIMVVKDGAIWTVNSAGDVAQTGLNNVNAKIVGGLMTLGFKTTNGILDILGKNAELFGKVTDSYINQVTTILGNQLDIDNQGSLMQAAQKMIKGGAKITKDSVKPLMEAAEEIAKKGGKTLKDVIKDFGYMETAGAVLGYMGVTGKFQNMIPKDK